MAIDFIKLIKQGTIENIGKDAAASVVITLVQLDKVVTAKTARSVRYETKIDSDGAEISVYGGGGMKYIVEGKPANTKLPMRKNGNKWELVQELKDWKAIRHFNGADFVLARSIAKNKREGINIAEKALKIFEEMNLSKISNSILSNSIIQVTKEIKI